MEHDYLDELVRSSEAEKKPGGVIVCDHDSNHYINKCGFDDITHAPRVVVLPRFHSEHATAAERLRMRRGCMHPKLWLLHFDGGCSDSRFLRLVISSANLGKCDQRISNQYWVHDFRPRRAGHGGGCAQSAESAEHAESSDDGNPCEFEADLRHFVQRLLLSTVDAKPELWGKWSQLLDGFELRPPPGVHLVLSVPGRYSLAQRERYGHWALARHLAAARLQEEAERITAIEYCLSSCGKVCES